MIKIPLFGILNFGNCDLFGICVLLFEIYINETRTLIRLRRNTIITYKVLSEKRRYTPSRPQTIC